MSVDTDVVLDEKIKIKQKKPKKYKVVFLNDDTTPMEFVVRVLMEIFKHSADTAEKITITIHNEGSGVVGVFNYEIAEQKSIETTNAARSSGFQLQVRIEEE
jgi:ATP-dependent Clp protease adaptor protein ClpS